jgi:hypothetical protein
LRELIVEEVDQLREAKTAQKQPERSRQAKLGENRDAAAFVAGDRRAVAQHQPPALHAFVLRDGSEQHARLVVGEWKQRELLPAVELGDDTRRAATEPSGAGVEKYRTRERHRAIIACAAAALLFDQRQICL